MHSLGEGVTRNFLTILESEARRTHKSLVRIVLVALGLSGMGWVTMHALPGYGYVAIPALYVASMALGVAYTRAFVLDAYEVSLRGHWNRWMRWSVSCRTVRECYDKVHDRRGGPRLWLRVVGLTVLVLAHLYLAVLLINGEAGVAETLPVLGVDAVFLGFWAGRRMVERRWYKRFLRSCNELLRDGQLGLWGIF